MSRNIVIGVAWTYANSDMHIGHLSAYVPADVLARYHRAVGDNVLMVSGTDCHGTPITERAIRENTTIIRRQTYTNCPVKSITHQYAIIQILTISLITILKKTINHPIHLPVSQN
jgi:methionyl-tRNA synthetase